MARKRYSVEDVLKLWREEGLQLPRRHKKRKRLYHHNASANRLRPKYPNHVWSIDFVHDKLSNGRPYKLLAVLDEYTQGIVLNRRCQDELCRCPRIALPAGPETRRAGVLALRQRPGVCRATLAGLAQACRHPAYSDLSGITVG